MSRRIYGHIESTLADVKDIERYRFTVNTAEAEPYREELVAGIVFRDYVATQKADVVLSIYTYNLREGFRNFQLFANVNKRDR